MGITQLQPIAAYQDQQDDPGCGEEWLAVQRRLMETSRRPQGLKTHVRLVAATNRKLDEEVRAGRFRKDLWYRLNVFPITVPPLRQRPEDIPLLVNHFIEKHCRKVGRPLLQVSKATMKALQAGDWPGNVRELENLVERAVISSQGSMFEIGEELQTPGPTRQRGAATRLARALAQLERDHIVATLEQLHWRVEGEGGAAEALGINASTAKPHAQTGDPAAGEPAACASVVSGLREWRRRSS